MIELDDNKEVINYILDYEDIDSDELFDYENGDLVDRLENDISNSLLKSIRDVNMGLKITIYNDNVEEKNKIKGYDFNESDVDYQVQQILINNDNLEEFVEKYNKTLPDKYNGDNLDDNIIHKVEMIKDCEKHNS